MSDIDTPTPEQNAILHVDTATPEQGAAIPEHDITVDTAIAEKDADIDTSILEQGIVIDTAIPEQDIGIDTAIPAQNADIDTTTPEQDPNTTIPEQDADIDAPTPKQNPDIVASTSEQDADEASDDDCDMWVEDHIFFVQPGTFPWAANPSTDDTEQIRNCPEGSDTTASPLDNKTEPGQQPDVPGKVIAPIQDDHSTSPDASFFDAPLPRDDASSPHAASPALFLDAASSPPPPPPSSHSVVKTDGLLSSDHIIVPLLNAPFALSSKPGTSNVSSNEDIASRTYEPEKPVEPPTPAAAKPERPKLLPQTTSQLETQYLNMLLALDDIPMLYNLLASFFTWILLAGFVIFPGTFASLQSLQETNLNITEARLIHKVSNLPLFVVAFVCCGIGAGGMGWLWWRWRNNYIWITNHIFLPGLMNSLAGVLSTLVNLYGQQNGEMSASSETTVIVTSASAGLFGLLTVAYNFWKIKLIKRKHDQQVGKERAGRWGEGILDLSKKVRRDEEGEKGVA